MGWIVAVVSKDFIMRFEILRFNNIPLIKHEIFRSRYLEMRPELVRNKSVLELGSGCE